MSYYYAVLSSCQVRKCFLFPDLEGHGARCILPACISCCLAYIALRLMRAVSFDILNLIPNEEKGVTVTNPGFSTTEIHRYT
jgi:hypothetical protein